jgi:ABC-type lipoprotein export system ATPase subunit
VYGGADGVPALNGVSFDLAAGQFVAVRGPSGCGKSTLLHLLGAMDQPTGGKVYLNDRDITGLKSEELARLRRRHLGFVFQAYNLFPTLTVSENVMLPLTLDGAPERSARQKAADLLEQVGLERRARHFPAQLSGGEMQRVAVARAIVAGPELLLGRSTSGSPLLSDRERGR